MNENLDLIAFKDEIKKAEGLLLENGLKGQQVKKLLKPLLDLTMDNQFWKNQKDGLVVFLSDNLLDIYKVPFHVEAFTYVAKGFYLTPLIPVITDKTEFYLLSITKNGVTFYLGSQYDLEEIELGDLIPKGVKDANKYDVYGKESQFVGAGSSNGGAIFFGNDSGGQQRKEELMNYLQAVDHGVMKIINTSNAPLVLSGVDHIISHYRQLSRYKNIQPQGIVGNHEHTAEEELHARAWEIVKPYFDQTRINAEEVFEDLSATEKTSSDVDEIVSASVYSRVDKLFLKENCHIWGYFDENNNQIVLHKSYVKGDEDLANKAAVATVLHGGEVYLTSHFRMPETSNDIAAVFRFRA